jgi:SAM-dependent methyltransferase
MDSSGQERPGAEVYGGLVWEITSGLREIPITQVEGGLARSSGLTTEFESYHCELCGSRPSEITGRGEDFEYRTLPGVWAYAICRPCQHLFLAARPRPEHLAAIYPSTYYTVNPESPARITGFVQRQKTRMDLARIGELAGEHGATSILDVGCGDVTRLADLRVHLGPEIRLAGIDFHLSEPARVLACRHNVDLIEANVEQLPAGEASYDLILMSQLIEHLFAPAETLRSLFRRLRPGGLILIDTPEWGSLDYRLFRNRYWGAYHFPRHFNIFSARSLRQLVTGCGFEVVEHRSLPSPAFWIISLRNALGLDSCRRSRSAFEVLSSRSVPVVALAVMFDKMRCAIGGRTSNQSIVIRRPADSDDKGNKS